MNLSDYKEEKPRRARRIAWVVVNRTLFRLFATRYFKGVRHFLLRLFGAAVDKQALVYSTCTIYAPWNLRIGRACIGPHTELYNKAMIEIGDDCVVSQGAYLCTASHDITDLMLPLKSAPIAVGDHAWLAANTFVGPGVTVGEGAVVGARAAVFKDVEPWTVVGGNPAMMIKKRQIRGAHKDSAADDKS